MWQSQSRLLPGHALNAFCSAPWYLIIILMIKLWGAERHPLGVWPGWSPLRICSDVRLEKYFLYYMLMFGAETSSIPGWHSQQLLN